MKSKLILILIALCVSSFSYISLAQPRQQDYTVVVPHKSDSMYAAPAGYRLADQKNISPQLGRIAQKILSRAVNEHWIMPSEIPLSFGDKQYIARYQMHGANKQNPRKHPGIGLYQKL